MSPGHWTGRRAGSDDLSAAQLVEQTSTWWRTEIIDVSPGAISLRGYPIEELMGARGFVETVWLMLRGELPSRPQTDLLEAALVASVDHGPQAPSIAISRMAVSCGLPVNGAMASAINVLDDVHGGPGQQCMELYGQIADEMAVGAELPVATRDVLARRRAAGERYVPGFGHRFHPLDPRAPRLLGLVDSAVATGAISGEIAAIGREVEAALNEGRERPIPMNVDGVTAVVYCELGFTPELGRGVFILARSVGILAHALEQMAEGGRIKGPTPPSMGYSYTGPPSRHVPPTADERRRTT